MAATAIAPADFYANDKIKPIETPLRECAREVASERKAGAGVYLRTGSACKRARDMLAKAGCEGKFSGWCDLAGISRSGAYKAIDVFERMNCVSIRQFEPTALIMLAAKSVPAGVRKKAVALADEGRLVTAKVARELLGPKPSDSNGRTEKPDKRTDFNPEELEAAPARETKAGKSGKPEIPMVVRERAQNSLAKLIRALTEMDLFDKYAVVLSDIRKDVHA